MEDSLLLTKLYIPPLDPRDVSRTHLIARINESLNRGCKLTLICAPVGYGKTTLVRNWLDTLNEPVAWLSLDPEDDHPPRFWSYVIAALQTVQPELGRAVLPLLQGPQVPAIEYFLPGLINQITALSKQIILVLDDYHLLATPDLHQGINFILDHLPPLMHLVIITREDPPLPLPQLRAKGQMLELRIKDLRFTIDESAEFLNNKMRLNLQPEETAVLGRRTEGWAAGLQMAALSLHDLEDAGAFIKAFAGDNRYVADYLISEVLDRQSDQIREFLLYTSIVDRFTPSLCDALTGYESSQNSQILERIEVLGIFILPLDHVRRWYRYHQLFTDLLRYRLRKDDLPRFVSLNRTASRWFEQQGFVEEAVKYALVAEDYDYVAELIERSGLAMIGWSKLVMLQNWIAALPEKIVHQHPYLSILLVWVGALTGQSELARKQLALANENLPSARTELYSEIVCQIALLRAYAARSGGELDASIEYAQEAISYLPANNIFLDCTISLNLGGNYWLKGDFLALEEPLKHAVSFIHFPKVEYPALAAAGFLANAYLQQGQLNNIDALCNQVFAESSRHDHPAAAYVFLEQGEMFYERNNLDSALEVLSRTIQIGENVDRIVNIVRACLLLSRVHQALGNRQEASNLLGQADKLYKQSTPRYQIIHKIEYEHYRASSLFAQKNLQTALYWASDYEKRREAIKSPWAVLNELSYAHVLLVNGQPDRALEILKACEAAARASGAGGWVIKSLLLQSLCYQAMEDMEQALKILGIVLSLAEPEGYARSFLDCGASMQQLLRFLATHAIASDYVAQLLAAFSTEQGENKFEKQQNADADPISVEQLTSREVDILRLMAAGLSHPDIAGELHLSVNTVKWYSSQIYTKMGVHRRAHAVSLARELRII